jgi:prepilin signal peptidase PulO-like enzyme (type II secretory pathway)
MILLVLIGLGLIFGSFVNALVWRLHEGKDWVRDRSVCTHCHHVLAAKDLVPVLSYLYLRGKCRYCRKPINDTPFAEVLTAVWFAASYAFWPYLILTGGLDSMLNGLLFGLWLVASVILIALLIYDKRWFLLPDKMVFPLIAVSAVWLAVRTWQYGDAGTVLLNAGLSVLVISGLFYVLFQVSKGKWIGGGDVKLGLALGVFAGTPLQACLLLFVASLAGTLAAVPALLQGRATRAMHIPFGPFLIVGLLITVLLGRQLLDWYGGLMAV